MSWKARPSLGFAYLWQQWSRSWVVKCNLLEGLFLQEDLFSWRRDSHTRQMSGSTHELSYVTAMPFSGLDLYTFLCLDNCPFSDLHLYPMTACPRHCGITPEFCAGVAWAWHLPVYCVSTQYSFLILNSIWTDQTHVFGCHPEFDFCFPIMP